MGATCLQLCSSAYSWSSACSAAFEKHEVLMAILREDLFVAFFSVARSPNLACLSGVCQVAFSLYVHLGSHLLLQVRPKRDAALTCTS